MAAAKVRSKVRTQWLALGGALVVLAAVVVAWALSRAADRVHVVQVARTVHAGDVIEAADLQVAGVAFDAQVTGLVPEESLSKLVGRVAATDLQPGVLMQVGMWRDTPALAAGEDSVGVVLAPGRFPPGLGNGATALAASLDPADTQAPVTVRVLRATTAADGTLELTLAVPAADSVALAQLAANDRLVLVGVSEAAP